jgi:hypothetical protein
MKNVTVSMDEDTHRLSRIQAAKRGVSMSRYIDSLVRKDLAVADAPNEEAERNRRLEALERFLSGPKLPISENGRMPTADERNARR